MVNRMAAMGAVLTLIFLPVSLQAAAPVKAPAPAKAVDLNRFYSGRWIEIGRRPMKLTDGCVAGTTDYQVLSPTKVDVLDGCRADTPTGKLKTIGGPGRIGDPGFNAKLHVKYRFLGFIPVSRDYWVLDHDDAYSWFISADPAFENLWIYTRNPHVEASMLKELIGKASAMGYDVTKLEFPAQP